MLESVRLTVKKLTLICTDNLHNLCDPHSSPDTICLVFDDENGQMNMHFVRLGKGNKTPKSISQNQFEPLYYFEKTKNENCVDLLTVLGCIAQLYAG